MSHGPAGVLIVRTGRDDAAHIVAVAESWAKASIVSVSLIVQPFYNTTVRLDEPTEQKKEPAGLIPLTY